MRRTKCVRSLKLCARALSILEGRTPVEVIVLDREGGLSGRLEGSWRAALSSSQPPGKRSASHGWPTIGRSSTS